MFQRILSCLFAFISFSTLLTGCHYSSDPYRNAWYDVYGRYCGTGYPYPGCNYYVNGSKIYSTQDPFYGSSVYYYDLWSYYDSYGYYRVYVGYAWLSNTGILYDQFGYALNDSSGNHEITPDVIAAAAEKEKETVILTGKQFSQRYSLAEEKGILISKTLQDWAVLARDRVRQDADVDVYLGKLYGVDPVQAKEALFQVGSTGQFKALEDLNADVAAHWGTTPETSRKILQSWYQDELNSMNLK